jgi:hypothetical protein
MVQKALAATGVVALVWFALMAWAEAADVLVPPAVRTLKVKRVQDCSAFYDPYHSRGFGWGSGPGLALGFGTFEGALPMYPSNSFPNWYAACVTWGHYSSTGSAR